MTALPERDCRFVAVPRVRGQPLKKVDQLDGWLRDGSATYVAGLCEWEWGSKWEWGVRQVLGRAKP